MPPVTRKTKTHSPRSGCPDEACAHPSAGVAEQPGDERGQLGSADLGGGVARHHQEAPTRASCTPHTSSEQSAEDPGSTGAKGTVLRKPGRPEEGRTRFHDAVKARTSMNGKTREMCNGLKGII